jgi:hypothetical protein
MTIPEGFTDDMSIVLPDGLTADDVVEIILRAESTGVAFESTVATLVARGLTEDDAMLAHDRALGGVVRAATGNAANEPVRSKDPVAWASFHRCLDEPALIAAIRPGLANRGAATVSDATAKEPAALTETPTNLTGEDGAPRTSTSQQPGDDGTGKRRGKRSGKRKGKRPPPDRELNPYLAPAAERAPRPPVDRTRVGALIIFVAALMKPLVIAAAWAARIMAPLAAVGRRDAQDSLPGTGGPSRVLPVVLGPHVLAALLGVMILVGAYRLTEGQPRAVISDELKAAVRLSTIVQVVILGLLLVTFAGGDAGAAGFFAQSGNFVGGIAEVLLALVAARHLARVGSGVAARAARWLAVATLAAIVVSYLLTRPAHDDMFNQVKPLIVYSVLLVLFGVTLWIGKLAVFGWLWRALAKRADTPPPAGDQHVSP